jgi:hypothetical protein
MKKFIGVFLTVIFLFSFAVFPKATFSMNNFTIIAFVLSPPSTHSFSSYLLDVDLSNDLTTSDFISITFPAGFVVPDNIPVDFVTINGDPVSKAELQSNANVLKIYPARTIAKSTEIILKIDRSARIRNPGTPGSYNFVIGISNESAAQTVSVAITQGISHLSVLASPDLTGSNAMYIISFYVSQDGGMSGTNGDNITIIFPESTEFTLSQIPESTITINGFAASGVVRTENIVKVLLPDSLAIPNGGFVSVQISENAGIKNPATPGDYFISIFTDKDPVITNTIFTVRGTSISNLSVLLNPNTQNAKTEIRIRFLTSKNGDLTKNKDKIFIKFPEGFVLPSHPDFTNVSVNGKSVQDGSLDLSNNTLILITPVNIPPTSSVNILIGKGFGIKNPPQKGVYDFVLYTSKDLMSVEVSVQINPSHISAPLFVLTKPQISANSDYKIIFFTGPGGALVAGIGQIDIVFPEAFSLPGAIETANILVNDKPLNKPVNIQQNKIIITVPDNISGGDGVIVYFKKECGIKNPSVPGVYTLTVFTSAEQMPMISTGWFINDLPISSAKVTPEKPDGLNGFYKTHPKITLSVLSPYSDTKIYYYFDNSAKVLYNGNPIVVPDGIHKFYFYAENKNGGIEYNTHEIDFKVDTVVPAIIITSPTNYEVNGSTTILSGKTEPGVSVKLNGNYIPVSQSGEFSVLASGSGNKTFEITATDPAGNSATKKIVINFNTVSQNPPALEITSPQDETTVYMADLVVSGKTDPGAAVFINGKSVSVSDDGTFTYNLTLKEGDNAVVVVAKKNGASTTKTIHVKYVKSIVIKLQIGNTNSIVNGEVVSLDAAPVIVNNRTLVPLRFISESFGANVKWDPVLRIVEINFNGTDIKLQIDNELASVGGKKIVLDAPPQIIKGRTMVPLRFIVESFNAHVEWDGDTQTITITYP